TAERRTASPAGLFTLEHLEHRAVDAGPRLPVRAEMQRRMDRHRHVDGTSSALLEQPAVIIVVVVAEEEVALVEVADALEIRLAHRPRPARRCFAAIDVAFDRFDDVWRLDQVAAEA